MQMEDILKNIRNELVKNSDPKTQISGQHYFKEPIKSFGVKSAVVSKISKDHFKLVKHKTKLDIFGLCDQLWQSGYMEESFIACNWSYFVHKQYEPGDMLIFKKWIKNYITNWATCDTFCNHTVGEFIEMYPEFLSELKKFAKSDNRWMRRASAVSLIVPARKSKFLADILEIADILLLDKDEMVQKGYGWMLKVASEHHQKEIFDYVIKNKAIMPRTALRYAIEKLPDDLKNIAMKR